MHLVTSTPDASPTTGLEEVLATVRPFALSLAVIDNGGGDWAVPDDTEAVAAAALAQEAGVRSRLALLKLISTATFEGNTEYTCLDCYQRTTIAVAALRVADHPESPELPVESVLAETAQLIWYEYLRLVETVAEVA